jgi:hypothetical protein
MKQKFAVLIRPATLRGRSDSVSGRDHRRDLKKEVKGPFPSGWPLGIEFVSELEEASLSEID